MADVSGHQFKRNSFDLITESPPWKIYFGWWICVFDYWHENAFLTIVMRILFWKQLAWWIYLEKLGQRAPVGAKDWHEDMLHHLWVELVFIVVEGVPGNMQKLSSKLSLHFGVFFHFHHFVRSSSIKPAGILAILILHSEVFEKTVVVALVLLPVLLNYDLAILQIEYYFLMLA